MLTLFLDSYAKTRNAKTRPVPCGLIDEQWWWDGALSIRSGCSVWQLGRSIPWAACIIAIFLGHPGFYATHAIEVCSRSSSCAWSTACSCFCCVVGVAIVS